MDWPDPMPLLSKEQYLATFDQSRQRVAHGSFALDFWPYFASIPAADFEGHDCSARVVENVWRMMSGKFEHILVNSENSNIFMVLVLDRQLDLVHGHRLLNMEREYGLDEADLEG